MEQDKNNILTSYIDGLKHFSNQELKDIKVSIENRLKKEFFENFKLQEGKCYINNSKTVLIKVKNISQPNSNSIKVISEEYSTFLNKLCYENNSVRWFCEDSFVELSQHNFNEISEEKYNKIIDELKSFEKQKRELNKKHKKNIDSILNG